MGREPRMGGKEVFWTSFQTFGSLIPKWDIDFSRCIGFPCAFIIALFAWLVKRFFEVFRKFLDCRFSPFQEPLSLNFCTYYIMPCGVCQEVFSIFFKIFLEAFRRPSLNFCKQYTTIGPWSQELFAEKLHNFGRSEAWFFVQFADWLFAGGGV